MKYFRICLHAYKEKYIFYVQLANKKRSERIFKIGDWAYLKLQPYRQNAIVQRKSQKLAAKYFGPYQITE
jgi:hypothetical protein